MALYALFGTMPLLWGSMGPQGFRGDKQVAYADDLTSDGKIEALKSWFDAIVEKGACIWL